MSISRPKTRDNHYNDVVMATKTTFTLLACITIFLGLVYYNYQVAQNGLQNRVSTPQVATIISFPNTLKQGSSGNFAWQVSASSDQKTNSTTIFYSYESTPSALTIKDSPEAVKYQSSLPDYMYGTFFLPDTFDVNISFPHPGRVWFRAYANIRDEHIWSEEKYLDIIP